VGEEGFGVQVLPPDLGGREQGDNDLNYTMKSEVKKRGSCPRCAIPYPYTQFFRPKGRKKVYKTPQEEKNKSVAAQSITSTAKRNAERGKER